MSNEKKVFDIIASQLSISLDQLNLSSKLAQLKGWDSLHAIRVMTALESALNIRISLQDYLNALSIGDILKLTEA